MNSTERIKMIFQQKEITLKNGKTAILKTPEISDAAGMLAYITQACGETDFLLRTPEEWEAVSIEKEEKWVKSLRESENTLAIACFIDGKIAGNCEISFRSGAKTSHRATVAIAVLKEYWSIGIGSAFFREMISAAEAREGIEIVELDFIEGNSRARALYEKFGFRITGMIPNAIRTRGGSYRNEYQMQLILPKNLNN
jgi:RimJ/RimL family protein N-acetyltransferase